MSSLYSNKENNITKTWLLMVGFLCIIVVVGWFFGQVYGAPEIVYAAVIFSLVMNIGSYWYSDKLALSLSGARPAVREEFFDLYTVTENLSITAGIPMPKIYVITDDAPNAFATGRNPEHATIAVTTGLLHMLDRSELEGVIAHELSHIRNWDILLSTVVVIIVGFLSLLSDFFLRTSRHIRGGDDNRGNALFVIAGIVLAILTPIAGLCIQLAISRKREFLADASGALLTRYPEGLAGALSKISSYTQPMKRVHKATAHLFISSPLGGGHEKKIGFWRKLFLTHPPVSERIGALLGKN
ncbi:MAG: M48 family metallopeptidase [Candidatus Campbellbacteria bacterium]|nr:M48 family metallopeptidase [Candidatus Campbellbacteria bacterium]